MLSNLYKSITLFLLGFLFVSCSNDKILIDQSLSVNPNGWKISDSLVITVNIPDTNTAYDFFVNVRNSESYKYANTFFFITTVFPNGEQAIDSVECYLADNKGNWIGKGMGEFKDSRFRFQQKVRFPIAGTYKFIIKHGMRDKQVSGLHNVGLRIIQSK